jgi:hypothetical protein
MSISAPSAADVKKLYTDLLKKQVASYTKKLAQAQKALDDVLAAVPEGKAAAAAQRRKDNNNKKRKSPSPDTVPNPAAVVHKNPCRCPNASACAHLNLCAATAVEAKSKEEAKSKPAAEKKEAKKAQLYPQSQPGLEQRAHYPKCTKCGATAPHECKGKAKKKKRIIVEEEEETEGDTEDEFEQCGNCGENCAPDGGCPGCDRNDEIQVEPKRKRAKTEKKQKQPKAKKEEKKDSPPITAVLSASLTNSKCYACGEKFPHSLIQLTECAAMKAAFAKSQIEH